MSIELDKVLAASPATTRGQPTQLSCDAKGERIAYASGKSIFVRSIDQPSISKQYTGHTVATTAARFSPSGFYIASGDVSGQVKVWDAEGAVNTKGEYHIISGRINDIDWDGDSQRIIAVGDGRERFGHCFTADSGNSVGEVSGHSKVVNSVAIRQQRPLRAATVSDDGTMCFLHGAPFKFNSKAAGLHKGFVLATAFSPDGNTLVTVGADRKVQLYDGKTGEPTKQIGEGVHMGSIFAVSWAADSKRFVTASADQTVRIWDAEAEKCVHSWRLGEEGAVDVSHQQVGVVWVRGRSDGLIISLNLAGDLNYLSEGSAKPIKIVQGHNKTVTAMAVSAGGQEKNVITGSFEGRVCRWDLASGLADLVDGQAHTNQITQMAAAPGTMYSVGWDDTLRVIDQSTNTFAASLIKLNSQPRGVAVTDQNIVVAEASGWVVYDRGGSLKETYRNPMDDSPTALATKESLVVIGTERNKVYVFRLGASKPEKVLDAFTSQISALSFSSDGKLLAIGTSAGKVIVYKTDSWEIATDRWSAHTGRVLCIAWNHVGTHAISGGLDTNIFVWSLAQPGNRVKALNAHKDGVCGVAWIDAKTVASTGGDAAVKLWIVKGLQ